MSKATPRPFNYSNLDFKYSKEIPIYAGDIIAGDVVAIVKSTFKGHEDKVKANLQANAELIVRAVNTHDDLIHALESFIVIASNSRKDPVESVIRDLQMNQDYYSELLSLAKGEA